MSAVDGGQRYVSGCCRVHRGQSELRGQQALRDVGDLKVFKGRKETKVMVERMGRGDRKEIG